MDRDEALRRAIRLAQTTGHIHVIHTYSITPHNWYVQDYRAMELIDASEIRYILPNGEVTKLS